VKICDRKKNDFFHVENGFFCLCYKSVKQFLKKVSRSLDGLYRVITITKALKLSTHDKS